MLSLGCEPNQAKKIALPGTLEPELRKRSYTVSLIVSGLQDVIAQEVVEEQRKPACGGGRTKADVSWKEGPRNPGTLILIVPGASFLCLDSEKCPNIPVIHSPFQWNRFKLTFGRLPPGVPNNTEWQGAWVNDTMSTLRGLDPSVWRCSRVISGMSETLKTGLPRTCKSKLLSS